MANMRAIHSVGYSLVGYLRQAYRNSELRTEHDCDFRLISSDELADSSSIDTSATSTLTLYLYRITVSEHLRNTPRGADGSRRVLPLSVNLHYLMTVWSEGAMAEHHILAWAMSQLEQEPMFGGTLLSAEAGWQPDEVIQMVPEELSIENLMRIWDALEPSYRLSVGYVARVVRIETESGPDHRPVVVTDFAYQGFDEGSGGRT
jgi:Pvc16 N-terminal domain